MPNIEISDDAFKAIESAATAKGMVVREYIEWLTLGTGRSGSEIVAQNINEMYLNVRERAVAEAYSKNGWSVIRGGWPDFLMVKDNEVPICLEVKSEAGPGSKLSKRQEEVRVIVSRYFKYIIERVPLKSPIIVLREKTQTEKFFRLIGGPISLDRLVRHGSKMIPQWNAQAAVAYANIIVGSKLWNKLQTIDGRLIYYDCNLIKYLEHSTASFNEVLVRNATEMKLCNECCADLNGHGVFNINPISRSGITLCQECQTKRESAFPFAGYFEGISDKSEYYEFLTKSRKRNNE